MARGDPDGEREFITYLRGNGIVAERDLSSWSDCWRVVRPATKDYSVEFVLIFFPPEATAEQMDNELLRISLAMMLNAPAHLAMSYPFYRAPKVPDSGFPNAEQDPTCKRLKELFKRYKQALPGAAKIYRETQARSVEHNGSIIVDPDTRRWAREMEIIAMLDFPLPIGVGAAAGGPLSPIVIPFFGLLFVMGAVWVGPLCLALQSASEPPSLSLRVDGLAQPLPELLGI